MTPLEKSILATLSYYDIFDYPLTGFEIWRYLIRSQGFEGFSFEAGEVFETLHKSDGLEAMVGHKFGFYCLRGRERIVDKRLRRKKLADEKWKKLKKVFALLVLVPYVRGIFVSGSLAMENSKDDSDVDIIVVARAGRIWTVRTLMTVFTFMLGVRRYGDKTRDRICLNHYITDQSLRIPFASIYNAESYVHLLNVYAEDAPVFRAFQEANGWIGEYLCNYRPAELNGTRAIRRRRTFVFCSRLFERVLRGKAGDRLEALFGRMESGRIEQDPLFSKAGGRITIDDGQLEFHPDSHERHIIPEFNRRMEALDLPEFAGQKDSGLNR